MSAVWKLLKENLERPTKWDKVILQVEHAVGQTASFLNLRHLLNDEFADVAVNFKKMIGTRHPIMSAAKSLVLRKNVPVWGLVVMLISKVSGRMKVLNDFDDNTEEILSKQRTLAELTEMLRASNLLHKGILNIQKDTENKPEANYCNKLGLLGGDYLLSTSFRAISSLRNQKVTEIMSAGLRDMSQCEFLGEVDLQNKPLPSRPHLIQKEIDIVDPFDAELYEVDGVLGYVKPEWTLRTILQSASLLSKACLCAVLLGGHSQLYQEKAYLFGKHFALAWQAQFDLLPFLKNEDKFSLIGAPVMFHMEYDPMFYEQYISGLENIDEEANFGAMKNKIISGPSIQQTEKIVEENCAKAIDYLDCFSRSEAKDALISLVSAVKYMT